MLKFIADSRDGGPSGSSCATCCCSSITLRPGETNIMEINYAPWSVPIGGPGIVPTMEFHVEPNTDSCPTTNGNGGAPVSNENYQFSLPLETDLSALLSLATGVTPAVGVAFTYKILPLTGPYNGSVSTLDASTGIFTYDRNPGYDGYDYFTYRTTDQFGFTVDRTVQIHCGPTNALPVFRLQSVVPVINTGTITTDQSLHLVRFPIYMPMNVKECEEFRLLIKQPANDCNRNLYEHTMCFDIRAKECV